MHKLNPNERLLIESGINHYKIVGPGLIWLAPWQKALTKLYIGPQDQSLQFDEVRTVQNIPVTVTARVLYQIDPALFRKELLPQIPWLNEGKWQNILTWRTEYVLRQLLADYTWHELGKEAVQQRLERQLTQTVADYLQVVGLNLRSISLVNVELPAELQHTILRAERDSIEPRGRALVLKEYFDIFGHDLAQAMPYIVQWELLNSVRKNDKTQILLTNSALSLDGKSPGTHPYLQMLLPFQQNN